jgi:hypothetical protein
MKFEGTSQYGRQGLANVTTNPKPPFVGEGSNLDV